MPEQAVPAAAAAAPVAQSCTTCRFYEPAQPATACRRYPTGVNVAATYWCGEWQPSPPAAPWPLPS